MSLALAIPAALVVLWIAFWLTYGERQRRRTERRLRELSEYDVRRSQRPRGNVILFPEERRR